MAVIDTSKVKKPYIVDRDEDIFIGLDFPLSRGDDRNGMFAATSTTLDAVKVNVRNLLQTELGERVMQPNLGVRIREFLFEPFTEDVKLSIQNSIIDTFSFWLPFVEIVRLDIDMTDANTLQIFLQFVLKKDPTTVESVQVSIGE